MEKSMRIRKILFFIVSIFVSERCSANYTKNPYPQIRGEYWRNAGGPDWGHLENCVYDTQSTFLRCNMLNNRIVTKGVSLNIGKYSIKGKPGVFPGEGTVEFGLF